MQQVITLMAGLLMTKQNDKEMVRRLKFILFYVLFNFACTNRPDLNGKVFRKVTPGSTLYIYFKDRRHYMQYRAAATVDSSQGTYTQNSTLILSNFNFFDRDLANLVGGTPNTITTIEVLRTGKCLYFSEDTRFYQYCEVSLDELRFKNPE